MPKNTKPAPPQQSNLAQMWGKKRKPTVKEDSAKEEGSEVIGDSQVGEMDVDVPVKPEISMHLEVLHGMIASPVSNGKRPAAKEDRMEVAEPPVCE